MLKPPNHNDQTVTVPADLSGYQLLADARLNKGTAFTEEERDAFGLHGLLPPTVMGIDDQVNRRRQAFREFATDLERYAFLRDLQDTNETLVLRAARRATSRSCCRSSTPRPSAPAAVPSAACSASRAGCS